MTILEHPIYLIDTNVISEIRKGDRANIGVCQFFDSAIQNNTRLYISSITIGELRRAVDLIFHRGDTIQEMRVPNSQHALDKLIAATALNYDLTVVTRNVKDFESTGARLLNPFIE